MSIKEFKLLKTVKKVIIIIVFTTSLLLFGERYLMNLINYRDLTPNCARIHSTSFCSQYYPWARSEKIKNTKQSNAIDPVRYTMVIWLNHMSNNTFSSAAKTSTGKTAIVASPLFLYLFAWIFFLLSLTFMIYYWRELWRNQGFRIFVVVIGSYVLAIWANRYFAYRNQSVALAMQPRYLLIIIPLVLVIFAESWRRLLRNKNIIASLAIIICMIGASQGGGFLTHVANSDETWVPPKDYMIKINQVITDTAELIVVGE